MIDNNNNDENHPKQSLFSCSDTRIQELETRIRELEAENTALRRQQQQPQQLPPQIPEDSNVITTTTTSTTTTNSSSSSNKNYNSVLTAEQIERYSRQLILAHDGFGVTGQVQLLQSSVLVVGAGGIGSTVLMYLATAGIGKIGIIDHDTVDTSNLHRQIIHDTNKVGMNKALSAKETMERLNPTHHQNGNTTTTTAYQAIPELLDFDNAVDILKHYDVIVDASDNPQTRYLLNDACVLLQKPLVSGSAVGTQGQCTVYYNNNNNNNHHRRPCYRCLYPKPQIQSSCQSCADAGVLGPVPGLIGILQAMETIKILTNTGGTRILQDHLLMYDSLQASFLRIQKPQQKRSDCLVCGDHPTIRSMEDSRQNLYSYKTRGPTIEPSTGSYHDHDDKDKDYDDESDIHVTCKEYHQIRNNQVPHVLLDVRVKKQFELCALPGAINIPLDDLSKEIDRIHELSNGGETIIYCLCRRGIASLEATRILRRHARNNDSTLKKFSVRNIRGGLTAWRKDVDPSFPKY